MLSLGFGFTEIGTVTPKPQPGNPRPRLFRLPKDLALINRMGFNNHGMENAVRNLRYRRPHQIIGGNLGKNTLTPNEAAPADYLRLFRALYEYVDYFVINVSCPNVANLTSLQDKNNLNEILRGLIEFRRGQNQYRPILLKISPDLTTEQIDDMISVLIESGLDGIVATNTTTHRDGLQTDPETVASIGKGGLSGAPLTKRSIEVVRYIHKKTEGLFSDYRRGRHHDRRGCRSHVAGWSQPDSNLHGIYLQRPVFRQTDLQTAAQGSGKETGHTTQYLKYKFMHHSFHLTLFRSLSLLLLLSSVSACNTQQKSNKSKKDTVRTSGYVGIRPLPRSAEEAKLEWLSGIGYYDSLLHPDDFTAKYTDVVRITMERLPPTNVFSNTIYRLIETGSTRIPRQIL